MVAAAIGPCRRLPSRGDALDLEGADRWHAVSERPFRRHANETIGPDIGSPHDVGPDAGAHRAAELAQRLRRREPSVGCGSQRIADLGVWSRLERRGSDGRSTLCGCSRPSHTARQMTCMRSPTLIPAGGAMLAARRQRTFLLQVRVRTDRMPNGLRGTRTGSSPAR